ncbi:auxin-responsive protein IAA26-like [Cicer arietinum]|uniref:Auxin-induced protein n=1 Tax=Cicer arietinum TaxID=3827 RepID=A0A1S3E914_CICAR|nr:auxin-responsive protein IAA26-like [Cicer arietinum]XP_012571893.1 auxin-responsive protein IAA26-like [Cicer arietinum]XP_012571894.1 auxin-responsive protein IAA26-like [Cicer arietinum]
MMDERSRNERESSEERKLELKLGPPSSEDWFYTNKLKNESLLSLGNNYFSTNNIVLPSSSSSFLNFTSNQPMKGKDSLSSQTCSPKVVELQNSGDNKVLFSPSSVNNTAVSNTSQKRTAPGPVVGWPPIRSFRKNLASSSNSKPSPPESHTQHNKVVGKKIIENYGKGLFVKINMDGVPIGRKVDLNAYDSYKNLSSAVDELFRGLLQAQRDSSCGKKKEDEEKVIRGILDGSGEYTLVYEDNEGDRMLVGDVPWHMFVSTVKRLRVLKSSELSAFTLGTKQDKIST